MNFQVTKKNKSGAKRVWYFYTDWDFTAFQGDNAKNRLIFCRFQEYAPDGRPTKTYDITSNQFNCDWSVAKPSKEILDKALEKLMDTWSVEILVKDSEPDSNLEEPKERPKRRKRKTRGKKRVGA